MDDCVGQSTRDEVALRLTLPKEQVAPLQVTGSTTGSLTQRRRRLAANYYQADSFYVHSSWTTFVCPSGRVTRPISLMGFSGSVPPKRETSSTCVVRSFAATASIWFFVPSQSTWDDRAQENVLELDEDRFGVVNRRFSSCERIMGRLIGALIKGANWNTSFLEGICLLWALALLVSGNCLTLLEQSTLQDGGCLLRSRQPHLRGQSSS